MRATRVTRHGLERAPGWGRVAGAAEDGMGRGSGLAEECVTLVPTGRELVGQFSFSLQSQSSKSD